MALPEGYLPREGDILTLRGKVTWDVKARDERVSVKVMGMYSTHSIELTEVVGLERRAWEAGDKALSRPGSEPSEVVAVYEDWVWIAHPDAGLMTVHANSIERWVDPAAAKPEEIEKAVAAAMQEPPAIAFSDDEGPGAVLIRDDPTQPPGSSAAVGDDEPF